MMLEHPEERLPDDFTDAMLTRVEAASYLMSLGVRRTPATLAKLHATSNDGPPCTHHGRFPRYSKRALHQWGMRQLTKLRRSPRNLMPNGR